MKLVFALAVSFLTFAANAEDKSSGCGLGWKVTSRQSLLSSYVRYVTNAVTTSTFGMTSGTSGCDSHSIVKNDKKDIHYAEANYHSLMVESAKGQGEYLKGFALVLGCAETQVGAFSESVQRNYDSLFPETGANPNHLVNSARGYCKASI